MSQVRVIAFPRDDVAFEAHVRRARVAVGTRTTDAFAAYLRTAYPLARVSAALPGTGFDPAVETWYVYRDGSIRHRSADDAWADDPSAARAVLDAEGLYLDANEAAAALFGVSREAIIGMPAGSFTSHEPDPELGAHLLELARRPVGIRSTATVCRPDGGLWPIEFVVTTQPGGGHIVTMRRLEPDRLDQSA